MRERQAQQKAKEVSCSWEDSEQTQQNVPEGEIKKQGERNTVTDT